MTSAVRAFQIVYNDHTKASRDQRYEPIDNSQSAHPDWFEYEPIRIYLSQTQLEDSTFYGFLSPSFKDKTNISGRTVIDFVSKAGHADVVTFSPFPCHAACFINVFEHGDFFHAGLFDAAEAVLNEWNPAVALHELVMHSRNTVFCNFFFAKPVFWRMWMQLAGKLFSLAEDRASRAYSSLNRTLEYVREDGVAKPAQIKVFVMERLASYLLATGSFAVRNYPPFEMPLTPGFAGRIPNLLVFDALKIAFTETGDVKYLSLYRQLRNEALAAIWPGHTARL